MKTLLNTKRRRNTTKECPSVREMMVKGFKGALATSRALRLVPCKQTR